MARLKGVYKPSEYSAAADEATKRDLKEVFDVMCAGRGEFSAAQAPWAIVTAQDPRLSLLIAKLGMYIAKETSWYRRDDLKELALQTLNYHYKSDFAFEAHLGYAESSGLGIERVAAIPYWRTSSLFNDEQRLVIEYTLAAATGNVPEELFSRVVKTYGEKGAIEFTSALAFWSFWAVINNATRPEYKPDH